MKGWPYYFISICFTALILLDRNLNIELYKLAVISVVGGYLLGCLLYSFSGLFRHLLRWTFNYGNYRHYYKTTTRKKTLVRVRLTPLSK